LVLNRAMIASAAKTRLVCLLLIEYLYQRIVQLYSTTLDLISTIGLTTIHDHSCNQVLSCSSTSGKHFLQHWKVVILYSLSTYTKHIIIVIFTGTTLISDHSCSGPNSCSFTQGMLPRFIEFTTKRCLNSNSFTLYSTGYTAVKEGSCNKVDACSGAVGKPLSNILSKAILGYHLTNILFCFYICRRSHGLWSKQLQCRR
jgi:hypothetical protein